MFVPEVADCQLTSRLTVYCTPPTVRVFVIIGTLLRRGVWRTTIWFTASMSSLARFAAMLRSRLFRTRPRPEPATAAMLPASRREDRDRDHKFDQGEAGLSHLVRAASAQGPAGVQPSGSAFSLHAGSAVPRRSHPSVSAGGRLVLTARGRNLRRTVRLRSRPNISTTHATQVGRRGVDTFRAEPKRGSDRRGLSRHGHPDCRTRCHRRSRGLPGREPQEELRHQQVVALEVAPPDHARFSRRTRGSCVLSRRGRCRDARRRPLRRVRPTAVFAQWRSDREPMEIRARRGTLGHGSGGRRRREPVSRRAKQPETQQRRVDLPDLNPTNRAPTPSRLRTGRSGSFPCIDGVRALAALAVVAFHSVVVSRPTFDTFGGVVADPPQRGRVGLLRDLRVSALPSLRRAAPRRPPRPRSVRNYAIRRVARIYPAYWVALAFWVLVLPKTNHRRTRRTPRLHHPHPGLLHDATSTVGSRWRGVW